MLGKDTAQDNRFSWLQIAFSIFAFIIGVFISPILGSWTEQSLTSGNNLLIIVFILIVLAAAISFFVWKDMRQQIISVEKNTSVLAKAVGQRVQVLPYASGYKELEKRIKNAESEIRVISNYYFDWENGKSLFDPKRLMSPHRQSAYSAIEEKLKREKSHRKLRIIRIVQIPENHKLEEIKPYDPVYYAHCKLLSDLGKNEAEFVSLRLASFSFPNSYFVIDRTFLYMGFEMLSQDTGEFTPPFVLLIDDPDSTVIDGLVKMHQRIEANSRLITNL